MPDDGPRALDEKTGYVITQVQASARGGGPAQQGVPGGADGILLAMPSNGAEPD